MVDPKKTYMIRIRVSEEELGRFDKALLEQSDLLGEMLRGEIPCDELSEIEPPSRSEAIRSLMCLVVERKVQLSGSVIDSSGKIKTGTSEHKVTASYFFRVPTDLSQIN